MNPSDISQNMKTSYDHKDIESRWQKNWEATKSYNVTQNHQGPKYYVLEMLPYPSGKIHVGHLRNYSIGDVIARMKRMQGYNVLHPMGWDAFGLPAENAAIEKNLHPKKWTLENIETMKKDIKSVGLSYDWDRELATCDPEYFKHEQKMFIEFFNANIAYQKESLVNWDPVDCTVLANEQVENGRGWRSGAIVEKKKLKQWFLKITEFADDILEESDNLKGWPKKVLTMQQNWIGKSLGAKIIFKTSNNDSIEVFSTRPETLFGASFIAVNPNHTLLDSLDTKLVKNFQSECLKLSRDYQDTTKIGLDTEIYAVHPFNPNIKIPVYAANFVLSEYGTGAVFGCPAHDERDHEFALKYNLAVKQVVTSNKQEKGAEKQTEYMINSDFLNDKTIEEARELAIEKLEEQNLGTKSISYKIQDWGISRQRYWGCPIPMIYCNNCGTIPVREEDLPIKLPEDIDISQNNFALANHPTWKHTKCHKCGADATRETDTFDTFFESSWYFIRYCWEKNKNEFNENAANYWLPVDQYIGGIEHAVMHLLYARFFTKALRKCGYNIKINEPFSNLLTQGMVIHASYKDKNGKWLYPEEVYSDDGKHFSKIDNAPVIMGRAEKMSKSKKNIVAPSDIIEKYGADTARMYLLSDSPPEKDLEWSDAGIEGCHRYLKKLYKIAYQIKEQIFIDENITTQKIDKKSLGVMHKTISDVTYLFENFGFNRAIARIRELSNYLSDDQLNNASKQQILKTILQLLHPVAPHITEEIWHNMYRQENIHNTKWPIANSEFLVDDDIVLAIQINGKLRGQIEMPLNSSKEDCLKNALELESVSSKVSRENIKKVIHIPNKIINIVQT